MISTILIKERIPAQNYYLKEIGELGKSNTSNWFTVNCPFHKDRHPSMGINILSGGFRCHGCGVKGGDIIAFEMQRYQLSFRDALEKLSQEWGIL